MHDRPIADSYWAANQFVAGEYPGDLDAAQAARKIKALRDAGVTLFLDLTEEGELKPYRDRIGQARHERFPIRDADVGSRRHMITILDTIDDEIAAGGVVYVHCWGGIGRTGTVVGCWLVRHGMQADEAIARIAELRRGTPDGWKESPETTAQRRMILDWSE